MRNAWDSAGRLRAAVGNMCGELNDMTEDEGRDHYYDTVGYGDSCKHEMWDRIDVDRALLSHALAGLELTTWSRWDPWVGAAERVTGLLDKTTAIGAVVAEWESVIGPRTGGRADLARWAADLSERYRQILLSRIAAVVGGSADGSYDGMGSDIAELVRRIEESRDCIFLKYVQIGDSAYYGGIRTMACIAEMRDAIDNMADDYSSVAGLRPEALGSLYGKMARLDKVAGSLRERMSCEPEAPTQLAEVVLADAQMLRELAVRAVNR